MSTVIVAGLAFAAVVLGLVTAILSLVNQRRAKTTAEKVQQISVQVDGRLSTLLERQSQLLDALHQSGTPVPPVPPVPGH
jgi:biopolymer transport protein ExbB/TolQ